MGGDWRCECLRHERRVRHVPQALPPHGKLIAFQLYYIKHYRLLGRPCCVRINVGWKLWGSRDKCAQYVGIYLNPVKGWKL